MSTDGAPTSAFTAAQVESWVSQVEESWQRLGVPARQRRLLAADLQRDIDEALTNGAAVAELVQPDPVAFASEVAEAQEVVLTQPRSIPELTAGSIIVTSVAGGLLGALLTWFAIFPIGTQALPNASDAVLIVLLYSLAFIVTVGCVVGAVAWRFRGRPQSMVPLTAVGVGFIGGALASVPVAVGLARMTGYSDVLHVVLVEALITAGFGGAGVGVAFRLSRRRHAPRDGAPSASDAR